MITYNIHANNAYDDYQEYGIKDIEKHYTSEFAKNRDIQTMKWNGFTVVSYMKDYAGLYTVTYRKLS